MLVSLTIPSDLLIPDERKIYKIFLKSKGQKQQQKLKDKKSNSKYQVKNNRRQNRKRNQMTALRFHTVELISHVLWTHITTYTGQE